MVEKLPLYFTDQSGQEIDVDREMGEDGWEPEDGHVCDEECRMHPFGA